MSILWLFLTALIPAVVIWLILEVVDEMFE